MEEAGWCAVLEWISRKVLCWAFYNTMGNRQDPVILQQRPRLHARLDGMDEPPDPRARLHYRDNGKDFARPPPVALAA